MESGSRASQSHFSTFWNRAMRLFDVLFRLNPRQPVVRVGIDAIHFHLPG